MKSLHLWSDKVVDASSNPLSIYSVIFTVDGSYLIASAGSQVLVYNATDGTLQKTLKGHKETVLCLSPLKNGGFASGGADKQVIIWSEQHEGILKYSHNDSIQSLSLNPVSGILLSCSGSDFGLWSSTVKSVNKSKVPARITCSAWSLDGLLFAIGLYSGKVLIRTSTGDEKIVIDRPGPVFSLSWSYSLDDPSLSVLVVADWNQFLTIYTQNGVLMGKDRKLGYDPCVVSHYKNGSYILVGGSSRKLFLCNSEGLKIGPVCEQSSWIWSCAVNENNCIAVGGNDGSINLFRLQFSKVYGIYGDTYAYRTNMTDIIVQNLISDQQVKIKCRDYVRKLSVYKDRIAVQLTERIFIYELFNNEQGEMHYRIKDKIQKEIECNLMTVTCQNIVSCVDKKLQSFNYYGEKEREWILEAEIRFMKAIGGPRGREGILIGLKNGSIVKVFLDSPFPVPILKHACTIKSLDLDLSRKKLAIIDENNVCTAYDVNSKAILYQEPEAESLAWNCEITNMICYSGKGTVCIKLEDFPAYQLKGAGVVVGCRGSRVFCLDDSNINSLDIPVSIAMERYIEKLNFDAAFELASFGVPESDWRRLAVEAMENLDLEIAKKSFIRIQDYKYLEGLRQIERLRADGRNNSDLITAHVKTLAGNYTEAAKYFKRSGNIQKAIDMFTELNMWEEATNLASESSATTESILKKKAQIQEDRKDVLAAAATYEQVGDYKQAINLLGPNGHVDKLIDIVRKMKETDKESLEQCVFYFKKSGNHNFALETLRKLGDINSLIKLLIDLGHWDESFKLVDLYPQFSEFVYLSYGNWLSSHDRFQEAQQFYVKASKPEEAIRVLKRLAENAVSCASFEDAAYHCWCLAAQLTQLLPESIDYEFEDEKMQIYKSAVEYRDLASIYHAYSRVYQYTQDPFTYSSPQLLLNASRFCLCVASSYHRLKISKVYCWYTIAKIALAIQAYKTSKYAFDKLLQYHTNFQNVIEASALKIRSKPISDKPGHHLKCALCGFNNPLISKSNSCSNCLEPFVFSFQTFEVLPLVQFVPKTDISDPEARHLINIDPQGELSSIAIDLMVAERSSKGFSPMEFDREQLLALDPFQVFIREHPQSIKTEYYRNTSDVNIVMCPNCQQFFSEEEWTAQLVRHKRCVFCRFKQEL